MSSENPDFTPGPNCKTLTACGEPGECQEAVIINTEARYERDNPGLSSLRPQMSKSRCQNEQAREARRSGNNVLSGG